jgi:outer membrane protein OmpA-like peptidoglycan-associated protein
MDFEKRPTAGFYVSYDPPIAVLPPPPERPDMATAPPPPDLGEAPPTPVTPTATPNEPEAKTPKLSKAARAKLAREERLAKAKAEKQARAERLAQAKADQLAKAEAEKQARAERLAQAKAEKQGKAETPPPEETPPEEAPKLSKAARAKLAREERLAKAKAEKQAREERLAQAKADRLAKAEAEKQAKAEKPAAPEKPEKVAKAEPEEAPPLVAPPKSQRAAQQRVRTELFNPSGITSHVVHFDFDAEQPRARFLAVLDGIARSLVEHPEIHRLRIEGHTDSIGDETYNQGLSERRARWVADYLVRKSVAAERVHSVGFGESRPRANGSDSAARAENRRIEFVIEE